MSRIHTDCNRTLGSHVWCTCGSSKNIIESFSTYTLQNTASKLVQHEANCVCNQRWTIFVSNLVNFMQSKHNWIINGKKHASRAYHFTKVAMQTHNNPHLPNFYFCVWTDCLEYKELCYNPILKIMTKSHYFSFWKLMKIWDICVVRRTYWTKFTESYLWGNLLCFFPALLLNIQLGLYIFILLHHLTRCYIVDSK